MTGERLFSVTLTTLMTLTAPASYCEPGYIQTISLQTMNTTNRHTLLATNLVNYFQDSLKNRNRASQNFTIVH